MYNPTEIPSYNEEMARTVSDFEMMSRSTSDVTIVSQHLRCISPLGMERFLSLRPHFLRLLAIIIHKPTESGSESI